MKPNFFHSKFVLLVLAGLCYASSSVMAQEHKMDHGAMDHSGPVPGQEYRADEPMDATGSGLEYTLHTKPMRRKRVKNALITRAFSCRF